MLVGSPKRRSEPISTVLALACRGAECFFSGGITHSPGVALMHSDRGGVPLLPPKPATVRIPLHSSPALAVGRFFALGLCKTPQAHALPPQRLGFTRRKEQRHIGLRGRRAAGLEPLWQGDGWRQRVSYRRHLLAGEHDPAGRRHHAQGCRPQRTLLPMKGYL